MWGKHDKIKKNMVKNHESVSNQSESGAENQWSDLEKIGESRTKVEVNPASIQKKLLKKHKSLKRQSLMSYPRRLKMSIRQRNSNLEH